MEYLAVKWLHVVSSTILFGTGIGSAYYMLMAGLRGRPAEVHFVARHVVIADWIFTATAVVVQPLTGLWLANAAGLPLSTPWIAWSIALYLVAGACWVPVLVMQYRMLDIARVTAAAGAELPPAFRLHFAAWVTLGVPAFVALLIVFWLMVARPV
jgi:uncharacterized membrane protein